MLMRFGEYEPCHYCWHLSFSIGSYEKELPQAEENTTIQKDQYF
jgi:hypothetical protein